MYFCNCDQDEDDPEGPISRPGSHANDAAKEILKDINGRSGMDTSGFDEDIVEGMTETWAGIIQNAITDAIIEFRESL